MPRIQSMSPLLTREGLNDTIAIYNTKNPAIWKKIAREQSTNDWFYRILQAGDLGPALAMNEATGINYDDFQTPFTQDTYTVKRGVGWAASTESMETDKYGVMVKAKGVLMAKSMNKTIEADVANFVNQSTSATFTGPDGQPLASTSHPLASGVASNILNASAGASSYTALALGPLALEQGVQEMMQQQSHRGDPMMFMGPYRLYVPTQLAGLANRILNAKGIQGTNTHDPNYAGGMVTEVVVDPYFTSQTAWAIRSISDEEHGLAFISRRDVRTNHQYDIDKDVDKYTLTRIWAKAILDWRGYIYSPGA